MADHVFPVRDCASLQRTMREVDATLERPNDHPYIVLWYGLSDGGIMLIPLALN